MAHKTGERVKQTTVTTGDGTLSLDGTVPDGFQGFVAGIGDAETCVYVLEDANGTAWEVGIGTISDLVTDTLARTTLIASSTGSKIVLTSGTHTVMNVMGATRGQMIEHEYTGYIEGGLPNWEATNGISFGQGVAVVDGTLLEWSSISKTGIGQAADGLSATGIWLWWLEDSSGAAVALKQAGDATYGNPTWDADLQYWKSSGSPGAGARCIGWHLVVDDAGTRKIHEFYAAVSDKAMELTWPFEAVSNTMIVLNHTAAPPANFTSLDISAVIPAVCSHVHLTLKVKMLTQTGGEWSGGAGVDPKISGAASENGLVSIRVGHTIATASGAWAFYPPYWFPLDTASTFYWTKKNILGTTQFRLDVYGGRMIR